MPKGVSVWREVSVQGDLCQGDSLCSKEQAVAILLECILVLCNIVAKCLEMQLQWLSIFAFHYQSMLGSKQIVLNGVHL